MTKSDDHIPNDFAIELKKNLNENKKKIIREKLENARGVKKKNLPWMFFFPSKYHNWKKFAISCSKTDIRFLLNIRTLKFALRFCRVFRKYIIKLSKTEGKTRYLRILCSGLDEIKLSHHWKQWRKPLTSPANWILSKKDSSDSSLWGWNSCKTPFC